MNTFAMSVLAALALRPIMGAEETSVVRLDRQAEQEAFEGRLARLSSSRSTFLHREYASAVLAHTKVLMCSCTRSYSGQHMVQGVARRGLLLRVERVHGAHQNFERIARNHFMTFVRQSEGDTSPVRLGSLSDQVPTCLKRFDGL